MRRRQLGAALTLMLAGPRAFAAKASSHAAVDGDDTVPGMSRVGIPGFAVARRHADAPAIVRGYGWADVRARRRVDADTVFHLASVSKVVTATAVLMLWESGAFGLDDPVAPHLDFALAHPRFPATGITFRQLLTHASGISDQRYERLRWNGPERQLPALGDFLRGYLAPGGRDFDAQACWGDSAPGAQWSYSNVGYALLGHLVQRIAGQPLDALTRERLFGPLGMASTAWSPSALPASRLARGYAPGALARALPPVLYPDWPAGALRSSARDFGRLLALYCGDGTVAGRRLLEPATLAEMFRPQAVAIPDGGGEVRQAIAWTLREVDGRTLASHSGGDPGTDALACVDRASQAGMFCVANVTGSPALRAWQKGVVLRELDAARAQA